MTTHTRRPADLDMGVPELHPDTRARRRHRRLPAAIVALAIAATAVALVDSSTAAGSGTWEQAEFRRMTALDPGLADTSAAELTAIDPSSEYADPSRHLRLEPLEQDSSHEFAEILRMYRWKAGDRSSDEAEFARQRALGSQADESSG